jgi:hypothetical protein
VRHSKASQDADDLGPLGLFVVDGPGPLDAGGQDGDAPLALADLAAERLPAAVAGDPCGVGAWARMRKTLLGE